MNYVDSFSSFMELPDLNVFHESLLNDKLKHNIQWEKYFLVIKNILRTGGRLF